jgi:hypothetical protein
MNKYFNAHPGNENAAILHYQSNIQISETFYPLLSILEVALRNSVNRELKTKFGREDWYAHFPTTPGLAKLNHEITKAQNQITKRKESISASKVVAELTLGFWVRLFNAEFEKILWKDLRRAFPFMVKADRKRHNVSAPLNNFRNFRNRVFHNEPICWNLNNLQQRHDELIKIMSWINDDLPSWAANVDRFDITLALVRAKI